MSKPLKEIAKEESSVNDPRTPLLTSQKPAKKRFLLMATCVCIVSTIVLLIFGTSGFLTYHFLSDFKSHDYVLPSDSKVLDYIDNSVNPCDNFFQFSCGKWLSANPLNGRVEWGTTDELERDNLNHLRSYLNHTPQIYDPDAIKKSKYIYSACMDNEYIKENLVTHLQNFINGTGGWASIGISPDSNWTFSNIAGEHYLGSTAFFSFDIEPNDLNSSEPIIKVRVYC